MFAFLISELSTAEQEVPVSNPGGPSIFNFFSFFNSNKKMIEILRRIHTASGLAKSMEQLGRSAWLSYLKGQMWTISQAALSHRTRPISFVIWFGYMAVDVKEKPTDFVVFDFFRLQFLSSASPPPTPSQSQDPRIRDIASLSNVFKNFKFSKMLDEDAISRIRESCDCDGGN